MSSSEIPDTLTIAMMGNDALAKLFIDSLVELNVSFRQRHQLDGIDRIILECASRFARNTHELNARAAILNKAVAAAQELGFENNGWIDSIDFLIERAKSAVTTDPLLLKPGDRFVGVGALRHNEIDNRYAIYPVTTNGAFTETDMSVLWKGKKWTPPDSVRVGEVVEVTGTIKSVDSPPPNVKNSSYRHFRLYSSTVTVRQIPTWTEFRDKYGLSKGIIEARKEQAS